MAKLRIKNLGPVKDCKMEINDNNFMVLTGQQASGKSTIVKCVYFFKSVKEILNEALKKCVSWGLPEGPYKNFTGYIRTLLRQRFLDLFGSSQSMDNNMTVKYEYTDKVYIEIKAEDKTFNDTGRTVEKYLDISFSRRLFDFFNEKGREIETFDSEYIKKILNIFDEIIDDFDTPYYIPAGRNLMSLLTSQLNYFIFSLDDNQKRNMDYCTLKFIENISKLKDQMSSGLNGISDMFINYSKPLERMKEISNGLLKGEYRIANGEERLYLDEKRFVKINYASSGQQEVLWILNLLYYIVASETKAFVVIEEPESHLYPNAQKLISEYIALASNNGCQILMTTHSPYILGALNNLKYASYLSESDEIKNEVSEVVPEDIQLKNITAYYVEKGTVRDCLEDMEEKLIDNGVIDDASVEINRVYGELFELFCKTTDDEESGEPCYDF